MRLSSALGSSEEKAALSLMPGFGEKCTTTVGGHFEAQKRTGAVAENVKAPYCGEPQSSIEERCDSRRYSSTDVFTSLPLALHENLDGLDNVSFEEGKKSRRHRTCKQIPSDTKRNSLPRAVALSAEHSASRRKCSLIIREPEESSVLMTETHNTSTPR